jgi:hypothetical protein
MIDGGGDAGRRVRDLLLAGGPKRRGEPLARAEGASA